MQFFFHRRIIIFSIVFEQIEAFCQCFYELKIPSLYKPGFCIQRQKSTIPGRLFALASTLCLVAPIICGSSVWNLLHVTLLAPRILTWPLDFWKNFFIPVHEHSQTVIFTSYLL